MPIEELIRSRQQEYYDALSKSDNEADSSYFVELMLEIILDTLKETTMVGKEENSNAPIRQIDGVLEKEILTLLKEEPTTTQMNLSKKLRIPYRTLQRKMKELQKAGKIERIGGKRYGYWEVTIDC